MVSVIGVILGLLAASPRTILAGAVGLAAASGASMGAGEYLADQSRSVRNATVMMVATLAGTLVPIVPFIFLTKAWAVPSAGLAAAGAAVWIAEQRAKSESRVRSYVETFTILVGSLLVTWVSVLLIGGA